MLPTTCKNWKIQEFQNNVETVTFGELTFLRIGNGNFSISMKWQFLKKVGNTDNNNSPNVNVISTNLQTFAERQSFFGIFFESFQNDLVLLLFIASSWTLSHILLSRFNNVIMKTFPFLMTCKGIKTNTKDQNTENQFKIGSCNVG